MSGLSTVPGRGRKPKPNKLKQISGSRHVMKESETTKYVEPIKSARPPQWLSDDAKKMWKTVVPGLCSNGILTASDLHNVEVFCAAYARWREAEKSIEEHGITITDQGGRLYKNPAVTVVHESLRQIATFGTVLGLDPCARQRLGISEGGEKEHDPWDDL